MDKEVEIYILTHKEIEEEYDSSLYKPILNGSINAEDDFGYIRDDIGDNISAFHDNYGELTSEYWVWKNSKADVIGFCHYRRWWVKNLKLEKLNKSDILKDLEKYDIILPDRIHFDKSIYNFQKEHDILEPDYDATYEDYLKVEEVLEEFFPDYAKCYHNLMHGNELWICTIFICNRSVADEYFKWLFSVIDKLKNKINLNEYDNRDSRVFAFISERLLSTYVIKHNFKIKEYPLLITMGGRKYPILYVLFSKVPFLCKLESIIVKSRKTLQKF